MAEMREFGRKSCLASIRRGNKIDPWLTPTSMLFNQEVVLLTESEVQRSFGLLFKGGDRSTETFDRAEELLEELRPESPLRHRLATELEELRKICASR